MFQITLQTLEIGAGLLIEASIWVIAIVLLLIRLRLYSSGGVCDIRISLDKRLAVITGAAQGIGRFTMEELLKSGCRVIFGDRDRQLSETVQKELNAIYPGKIQYLFLDLVQRESIKEFAKAVTKDNPIIDILVNNAGVMAMNQRILTAEGIEKQLAINYLGHFYLT